MISDKSTAELIKELNLLDESDSIEAKEVSGAEVGNSTYESICSFSNEPSLGGGNILLGIKRDETQLFPFYEVRGVKNPDKLQSDIVSACQSKYNMPIRPTIKREYVNGKAVLRIEVAELQLSQKPLFLKNLGLPRGAFRRIGSSDVHSTHEDLTAFVQDGVTDTFDGHMVPDSRPEDLDNDAITKYRNFLFQYRPSAEMSSWTDKDLLISSNCIRPIDDKSRATATGILMFGKSTALRRFFPQMRADYIRVPSKQWITDSSNRYTSIDMRGPIITLADRIIASIADDLLRRFAIDPTGGARRTDDPIIPHKAIREAVVNALMHRSYKIARPVQIIRFSNRLVIENPGHSLKAEEQFDRPGSISRNPHIAAILHETQFAETKGSGMRVMRQELQQAGLSVPTFESDRENDVFRVTFLFHHLLDQTSWEWLGKYKHLNITEDQTRALVFVRETGQISNLAFRGLTGLDTLSASAGLRKLCAHDLLEKKGTGANTYYVASERMMNDLATAGTVSLQGSLQDSLQDRVAVAEINIPLALKKRLVHLRLGKRADPEELKDVIVEICRHGPVSKEQIAGMINRNATFVAQNYLSVLVKEGRLAMTIPDAPSSPDQKYRAGGKKNGS